MIRHDWPKGEATKALTLGKPTKKNLLLVFIK